MENISIILSERELTDIVKGTIAEAILKSLSKNKEQMEKSLDEYFKKELWSNKSSQFENGLEWAVEIAFRQGLEQAMEELNFKEMIAQKAKEILSNNDFISELAEKKVRASLGL